MCVGGSQGSAGGGGAVGVTGAGEGTVAIAIEWRLMAKGRVRKCECLRTLRVALHTVRERGGGGHHIRSNHGLGYLDDTFILSCNALKDTNWNKSSRIKKEKP